jgi:hypothetical protein
MKAPVSPAPTAMPWIDLYCCHYHRQNPRERCALEESRCEYKWNAMSVTQAQWGNYRKMKAAG